MILNIHLDASYLTAARTSQPYGSARGVGRTMARSVARTTSPVPQGRGAPQRHSIQNNNPSNETNNATARTGQIDRAWLENGPSTVLAFGAAGCSNGGPNNPHASRETLANTEHQEVCRAVPLYQGSGPNIWGASSYKIPTTGSHPAATDAATAALRGLAPSVQGEPPTQGQGLRTIAGSHTGDDLRRGGDLRGDQRGD